MKVLQYGYGRYGKAHARAWREQGVDLLVVDPNPDLGAYLTAPATYDPDIVDIVTPEPLHAELVTRALQQSPQVFCEKPLSTSREQILAIRRFIPPMFHNNLAVGYGFRFVPGMRELRDQLYKNPPLFLKVDFYAKKKPRTDTSLLWSDGVHCLDLIDYLLPGDAPIAPISSAHTSYFLWHGKRKGVHVAFEVANGVPGAYNDPVIEGAKTTKRVIVKHRDQSMEILDFSEVRPHTLLTAQFQAMMTGYRREDLGTLDQSLGLTEALV